MRRGGVKTAANLTLRGRKKKARTRRAEIGARSEAGASELRDALMPDARRELHVVPLRSDQPLFVAIAPALFDPPKSWVRYCWLLFIVAIIVLSAVNCAVYMLVSCD